MSVAKEAEETAWIIGRTGVSFLVPHPSTSLLRVGYACGTEAACAGIIYKKSSALALFLPLGSSVGATVTTGAAAAALRSFRKKYLGCTARTSSCKLMSETQSHES